jgi:hypothetical protein
VAGLLVYATKIEEVQKVRDEEEESEEDDWEEEDWGDEEM